MPFTVGESVGPYRIIEQLGQGGMATVFKAFHASLDRYVAIKALHPAFNQEAAFEARFQREARVVAKLEHPNIVPVYDFAEHEKRPYLVMKFIEGDTLKARLEQGPLSSEEISKVVDAVGAALAYAHRQGVLHRDIKPSNVLLAKDGQIYLADFGLARIAQSGESTLSSDTIMGTPQYISPEQATGLKDLDERTDLYSFGVMLYELVVGRVPFNADTPFAVIHDHIYSPLPPPHTVNPNVPESVERVLLKSLAKERGDRYENVTLMVAAFKNAWVEAGVPMQGTFVKLSQSIQPVEAQPAKPAATKVEGQAGPTQWAAKAEPTVAGPGPEKRRLSPWLWVGAGLFVVLCIGLLAFARSNRLFARLLIQPDLPTSTPFISPPTLTPMPLPISSSAPPTFPPPPGPVQGNPPPEVMDAQRRANDHPNDPNAQLDLALAFWGAKMPGGTFETLPKVIQAAGPGGPNNEPFYIQAGDKFVGIEGWLPAAFMYFQVVRARANTSEGVPSHVQEAFREAMYKAADRPEVAMIVPFDRVAEVDQPIALITQARNAFYTGRLREAHDLLDQAYRVEDTLREGYLLEGEFASVEGDKERAQRLLQGLVDDHTSTPEWIRLFADNLLKRMQ